MMALAGGTRVLVMIAHPDDAEVHAGGTVARWVDEGHEVHYVLFTSGDKGHAIPRSRVTRCSRYARPSSGRRPAFSARSG